MKLQPEKRGLSRMVLESVSRLDYTDSPPEPGAPDLHSHTPRDLTPPAPPAIPDSILQTLLPESLDSSMEVENGWEPVIVPKRREFEAVLPHRTDSSVFDLKGDRNRSAQCVEKAYIAIHRTQALLAYCTILGKSSPHFGEVFEEAKLAYGQSLSHHRRGEFSVAIEYAAASQELSFTVECRTANFQQFDSEYPTLVSPPPKREDGAGEEAKVAGALNAISAVLARAQECLRSGTLPTEDREQVRKVVSWAEGFYREALRSFRCGDLTGTEKLAEAAGATARAAQHLCKQSYMLHMREV
jgi:hypothetical protein